MKTVSQKDEFPEGFVLRRTCFWKGVSPEGCVPKRMCSQKDVSAEGCVPKRLCARKSVSEKVVVRKVCVSRRLCPHKAVSRTKSSSNSSSSFLKICSVLVSLRQDVLVISRGGGWVYKSGTLLSGRSPRPVSSMPGPRGHSFAFMASRS